MADTTAVASRLNGFVQTAQQIAKGSAEFQARVKIGPPRVGGEKDRILVTYEECLETLSPEERAEFDHMIRKMSGIL